MTAESRLGSLWRELGRDRAELDGNVHDQVLLVDDLGMDSLEILVVIELAAVVWAVALPEQMDWGSASLGDLDHYLNLG